MLKQPIPICEFLGSLPLFKGLDPCALARLAGEITAVDAPKGTVLLRRGDPCLGFHVVVFGQVKLCLQTVRGDEKVVDLLDRGESFGESTMFLDRPYRITAEALTDSKLLHLCKSVVLAEVEREPSSTPCGRRRHGRDPLTSAGRAPVPILRPVSRLPADSRDERVYHSKIRKAPEVPVD